mmetsp:Transcript_25517/g.66228  ORF Transcript_25517/g.66228 Transcript_25517/m.66228 type:complete len:237 (+) Transcript_25517:1004-1714(+)
MVPLLHALVAPDVLFKGSELVARLALQVGRHLQMSLLHLRLALDLRMQLRDLLCRARQLVRQALGMCGQRLLAAEVCGNEEVALLDVLAGLIQSIRGLLQLVPRVLQLNDGGLVLAAYGVQLHLGGGELLVSVLELGLQQRDALLLAHCIELHLLELRLRQVNAVLLTAGVQFRLDALHLERQVLDVRGLGNALVDLGLVADVLSAVRVVQRAQRLLLAAQAGCNGGNDAGLGLTA